MCGHRPTQPEHRLSAGGGRPRCPHPPRCKHGGPASRGRRMSGHAAGRSSEDGDPPAPVHVSRCAAAAAMSLSGAARESASKIGAHAALRSGPAGPARRRLSGGCGRTRPGAGEQVRGRSSPRSAAQPLVAPRWRTDRRALQAGCLHPEARSGERGRTPLSRRPTGAVSCSSVSSSPPQNERSGSQVCQPPPVRQADVRHLG